MEEIILNLLSLKTLIVVIGNLIIWGGVFHHIKLRSLLQNNRIEVASFFDKTAVLKDLRSAKDHFNSIENSQEKSVLKNLMIKLRVLWSISMGLLIIFFLGMWLFFLSQF